MLCPRSGRRWHSGRMAAASRKRRCRGAVRYAARRGRLGRDADRGAGPGSNGRGRWSAWGAVQQRKGRPGVQVAGRSTASSSRNATQRSSNIPPRGGAHRWVVRKRCMAAAAGEQKMQRRFLHGLPTVQYIHARRLAQTGVTRLAVASFALRWAAGGCEEADGRWPMADGVAGSPASEICERPRI